MGCVSQVGEQALNVGRMSALVAGWPETVCGTSVDRQCGSSLQAAFNATAAVQAGHLDVVVASGVESMSRVPMGSNLDDQRLLRVLAAALRALGGRAAGHLGRGDRRRVGALARRPRRVLAASRTDGRLRRSTRAASSARSCRSRSAPRAPRCWSRSTRTRVATPRSRSWARSRRRSRRTARSPRGTRARSSTAPPRCSSRARLRSSRLELEPRGAVPLVRARRRRPVSNAPRQPARVRARAREGRPRLGRHGGDRGERGVRVRRAPVPEGHRACTSAGRRGT